MEINYCKKADSVYISLPGRTLEKAADANRIKVAPSVLVDYDNTDKPIGVELIAISKLSPEDLENLDVLTTEQKVRVREYLLYIAALALMDQ